MKQSEESFFRNSFSRVSWAVNKWQKFKNGEEVFESKPQFVTSMRDLAGFV